MRGNPKEIHITDGTPGSLEAEPLLKALSKILAERTGDDGVHSFSFQDVLHPKSKFLIAFKDGEAVGCGALRFLTNETCEIKRMYSSVQRQGIGTRILEALENEGRRFNYQVVWLETRKVNTEAVQFYMRHGYKIR